MNAFQQTSILIYETFMLFSKIPCLLFGHKFKLPYKAWIEVDGRMKRKNGFVKTTYYCRCGVRDDRDNRSSTT